MTEFEMMKKMIERLSSKIDWEIEGNVISIHTSYDVWVTFEFDRKGKAIDIN